MKKVLLSLLLMVVVNISAQVLTPQASPKSKLEQKVGLTDVTIEYSRPGKKGRKIFGDLVPYGKVWRTGANENTTITFSDDVTIEGKTLAKGTYALYTKPNKTSWDVLFYSDAKNWGNPKKWDDNKVVVKTTINPEKNSFTETFTISVDNVTNNSAKLNIIWDETSIKVPFVVPTDKGVEASIVKTINGNPTAGDYYEAASYYHATTGKNIKKAQEWIDKAVEMTKDKPKFWVLHKQALIHKQVGNKERAKKAAKKSLELAKKAKYDVYIKKNEDLLKSL